MPAPLGNRLACILFACALGLLACPPPPEVPDAGPPPEDAGPLPSCDSPAACKVAGVEAVCRAGLCRADVKCGDDAECGLGERCALGRCLFTGCTDDGQCKSGKCRMDVFACAECGKSSDCPAARPVCDLASHSCFQCKLDQECNGGAPYCDDARGQCVYCKSSEHCPNGLSCGTDGLCHGVKKNGACPEGTACDLGLMCINLNSSPLCLTPCSLYTPDCPTGQVCLKLTFAESDSLVFDKGEPLGVCYNSFPGLKYYREACTRTATTQSCQPNLECVPDSSQTSVCRAFCNPNASGTCPPGELCHSFPGDYEDHRYGLCYPDNGYANPCGADSQCRPGQACAPAVDPSASEGMSNVCRFRAGSAPALAPCSGVKGPDGGAVLPDAVCASGACRGDDPLRPLSFFCYGACRTDADCSGDGGLGTCDAEFEFVGTNVTANLKGCRPTCRAGSDCQGYGSQVGCRTRLTISYAQDTLAQTCSPILGPGGLGAACSVHSECREGFCYRQDGRGGSRQGVCTVPCNAASDCAADAGVDGGVGGMECRDVALYTHPGPDGVANSSDDRHVVAHQCGGGSCSSDADCAGGMVCAPDPSPTNRLSELVLRCLPPTRFGTMQGAQPCTSDSQCLGGACVMPQAPSTGTSPICLLPCSGTTACPSGTSCKPGSARIFTVNGSVQSFTACTP